MPPDTIAVLAEKPAVARDIARVLGASQRGEGCLRGNGYVVTWAVGHLVELAQPHEINPEWKRWRRDHLPMLPGDWPLIVSEETKTQFEAVRRVINAPEVERVICATDAGREGELIFRYIYEAAGCRKPFQRLWISSLTPDAIRQGFRKLRDGRDLDPLADAARGRSRADWLVGMNLSRMYSLDFNQEQLSVGRVQTPTLAMMVERELAIRAFAPEDYLEVVATFSPGQDLSYKGTWFRGDTPNPEAKRIKTLPGGKDGEDLVEAMKIVQRARTGKAAVESIRAETRRMPPPLLYDLTELQRHANRLYGFSAKKTLGLAQTLYEQRKLISYPRTDSRHLSADVAATLSDIVRVIEGPYRDRVAPGTGERPLSRRFVDDSKVTDHHAIIPTTTSPGAAALEEDEKKIYDLICRRLLSAWHDDHVWSVTTVITAISNPPPSGVGEPLADRFHSTGTLVEQVGWKVLDIEKKPRKKEKPKEGEAEKEDEPASPEENQTLPSGLAQGQPQEVTDVKAVSKQTRPPKRFTEATLLTAMETAGKTLDDRELSDAMKDSGLGTPATRAEIIETLLRREYIVRMGKVLEATDKGIRLIEIVHPHVKSPAMTGQWEAQLQRIQRGQGDLGAFMRGIETYVREVVGEARPARPVQSPLPEPSPPGPLSRPLPPSLTGRGGKKQESLKWLDDIAPTGLQLLFFGGKGGVGKTTCSAAVALALAERRPGARILLISTDPAHSVADVLEVPLGDDERPVPGAPQGLRARELDAGRAFAKWQERYRDKVDEAAGAFAPAFAPDNGGVQDLLDLTPPGIDELIAVSSLLDAVFGDGGEPAYDLVVVDTAPTGHALRLLEMPELALSWDHYLLSLLLKYREAVGLGGLAQELVALSRGLKRLEALLRDPARARFVVVTRAAELPRRETVRLLQSLKKLGIAVPAVIINAVPPDLKLQGFGRCAIIRAPAEFPPPRGVARLAAWARSWERWTG
jgi:DNA topoisomerase III/TRC40/GET3/ArsA family transport-energizing ATPase